MDAGVLKLLNSLKTGNLKLAGELLGRGCDPNCLLEDKGVAPMHLAAGLGPKAVCLLVQYGGDPNVRSVDETTPVHVAAIWDQPECLQLLLDNGGDPFLRDQDGLSALDLSRNYGNADIEQLLVNYLFLLNATSHDQTITPKYTIKRLSTESSASQKSPSPDVTDTTIDMSVYNSHYMEDYLHEATRGRKSAIYLDHVQRQMDRYFSDGRHTHLVDITSPDHPYIEQKDAHSTETSPGDITKYENQQDLNEDTSRGDITKYENQQDLTEDSLHLQLSLSDNDVSMSCDSFVTCDGEDMATAVTRNPARRDHQCSTDGSDSDTNTESNTVIKYSKFRTSFEEDKENYCLVNDSSTHCESKDSSQIYSSKYHSQNDSQHDDSSRDNITSSCRSRTNRYCRRTPLFTVDESPNIGTDTDKCEYCGSVVDSNSSVLCSGCERLNNELDSLLNMNEKTQNLPDVLPRTHIIGHNINQGFVIDDYNPAKQGEPFCKKMSRYKHLEDNNRPVLSTRADSSIPDRSPRVLNNWRHEGNKENLPDKVSYCPSLSVNQLVRDMRRSSLSELANLLPRSSSPGHDSLISSDESFMASNLENHEKAEFHPSDISTITIGDDETASYQDKAFIEADSKSYRYQASINKRLDSHGKYQTGLDKCSNPAILRDRSVLSNAFKSVAIGHDESQQHGRKVRSVHYGATKSKPSSSFGDNHVTTANVNHNYECVSSGSRVDLEPDRNPSLECQDLWAQVRADKLSRSNMLNTGFCGRVSMNSYLSDTSTVDYVYLDQEHGIMLLERHIPSTCGSVGSSRSIDSPSSVQSNELPNIPETGSQKNNLDSSQDTILYDWQVDDRQKVADRTIDEALDESAAGDVTVVSPELLSLTDVGIRTRLRTLGDEPGPVTDTTRQAYLTRLSQLQADPTLKPLSRHPPEYPRELSSALAGSLDLAGVDELETRMFYAFQQPNRQRRWREGTLKSSFTYILLDPRITMNLPNRARNMGDLEVLNCFISAIFYIGKGKRARPYCHLYEAIKHKKKNTGVKGSSKVEQILDIWRDDLGVVSLHCFQSVIPVEAYTREACMVDAVGLAKLTNMKRGDYYGVATTYSMKQRRIVGVHLLKKALQIFLAEGERQISDLDIKGDG